MHMYVVTRTEPHVRVPVHPGHSGQYCAILLADEVVQLQTVYEPRSCEAPQRNDSLARVYFFTRGKS